ncbi:MAG TPA: hypothetical protein VGP31_04970 [Planosporangium sp.]|jgi:hypothetical protein|nr:hypothetical protein [Planosporangium sp.]
MLVKWMNRLSEPKPRHYTGRHRAARTWRRTNYPVPPADLVT